MSTTYGRRILKSLEAIRTMIKDTQVQHHVEDADGLRAYLGRVDMAIFYDASAQPRPHEIEPLLACPSMITVMSAPTVVISCKDTAGSHLSHLETVPPVPRSNIEHRSPHYRRKKWLEPVEVSRCIVLAGHNARESVIKLGHTLSKSHLGQKKIITLITYPVDQILLKTGENYAERPFNVNGNVYWVGMGSHRYLCFRQSGTKCVCCGLQGTIMALQRFVQDPPHKAHFNLYGPNESGHMIMLTKDHITPKSKSGKNRPENYQTLCYTCNKTKGAKKITIEQLKEVRRCNTEAKKPKVRKKKPRQLKRAAMMINRCATFVTQT